ncbi:hypothetical protein ACFORL_02830 [Legionella dresdenensis]|uniref:Uncharacterized protein n=1 Tax=Legionella dresdenensis TaxID=450200 RepID=A0ABV8CDJ1_9GAMM
MQLENLNLLELNILLGHLRLGAGHLASLLDKNQYRMLLDLSSLNREQNFKIRSNRAEKSGNIALGLNTVITSVFGAWMGFSGFAGLHLNSISMLIAITGLALFSSIVVGFLSFKLTAQNTKSAIHNQKIYNLQINVIELIIARKKEELSSHIKYLNNALHYIQEHSGISKDPDLNLAFESGEDFSVWKEKLTAAISQKTHALYRQCIYRFYCIRLHKIIDNIDNAIYYFLVTMPEEELKKEEAQQLFSQRSIKDDTNLLSTLLTTPTSPTLTHSKSWFRKNMLPLLAGLIPTFFGSFASMFVFLSGGPNIAREMGMEALEQTIRSPGYRLVEFSIAIILTLYYAASFIYSNYKMYLREQEVEKAKKVIIQCEQELFDVDKKIHLLVKLKSQVTRIINIYTATESIAECLVENNV